MNASLGRYIYVNHDSVVSNATVARYSCIGPHCIIGGVGSHPIDRRSIHRMFYSVSMRIWNGFSGKRPIEETTRTIVGNDVWVGLRGVVLDGVVAGDAAVIAAGSARGEL